MRSYHRPATDRDLRAITHGRGSLRRNLLTASLPIAALVFIVAYVIFRSAVAASAIATVLFAASAVSNIRFFRRVQERKTLRPDEAAVEVTEVEVVRVLDIEPLGDNAPAFCGFTADGKAVLLVGQWLLNYPSFPSTRFRLYRWTDDKKLIRLETSGRRLAAEHSTVQICGSHRIGEVEFFDARPETLQEDLDRAFIVEAG